MNRIAYHAKLLARSGVSNKALISKCKARRRFEIALKLYRLILRLKGSIKQQLHWSDSTSCRNCMMSMLL